MSDFFTRLAQRTLSLALTIQPIKHSLFAPEPDYAGGLEIAQESEAGQVYSSTEPVAEMSTLPSDANSIPAQMRAVEAPAARSSHTQTEYPHPPTTSPAQRSTGFTSTETPVNEAHAPGDLRQLAQHGLRYTPGEGFSPNSMQGRRLTTLTSEMAEEQSSTHTSATTRMRPVASDDASFPLHAEQERSGSISDTKQMALSPATLQAGTGRERVARPLSPPSPQKQMPLRPVIEGERSRSSTQSPTSVTPAQVQLEASAVEPAIQVTIGRIEVRAVSAPATPSRVQQQPTRPAAMSLDEYLRRQEQGGRK